MLSMKPRIVLAFFLFTMNVYAFSKYDCLHASYETSVKTQGKFFGLVKQDLAFKKDKCNLEIKSISMLSKTWQIDVCREPVHLKLESNGSWEVLKRKKLCQEKSPGDFCESYSQLKELIMDRGLIFAEGVKERLSDAHGQIYCVLDLVRNYIDKEKIYSIVKPQEKIHTKGYTQKLNESQGVDTASRSAIGKFVDNAVHKVKDIAIKVKEKTVEEAKKVKENTIEGVEKIRRKF